MRIVDARIEIECSSPLTLKAAYTMDTVGNKVARAEISMIQVKAPNAALAIIDDAVQVHGGGVQAEKAGIARRSAMRALPAAILLLALVACGREPAVAPSGRDTFLRYCASCHGAEGRGDGPLAGSLTKPPADLTQIAARNGGRYDQRAVMEMIDGRRKVAAHGERDMPVWGVVFEEEGSGEPYPAYQGLLKSRFLVDYLATLQTE